MNDRAELYCNAGGHWVHIEGFYHAKEGQPWYRVTYPDGAIVNYGKPAGTCKECQRVGKTVKPRVQEVESTVPFYPDDLPHERPAELGYDRPVHGEAPSAQVGPEPDPHLAAIIARAEAEGNRRPTPEEALNQAFDDLQRLLGTDQTSTDTSTPPLTDT